MSTAALWRHFVDLLPHRDDYRDVKRTWRRDALAGVTVGIVALPLALAFGVSSGAGAEAGLITAIIAGIVAAVFGGSNVQVSGPTGAMVVVLGPIIANYGIRALGVVCVLAGAMVLAMGLCRLGQLVSFIPWPVIEGFTLGIAVIIFLQQVPAAFGVAAGPSSNAFLAALQAAPGIDWSVAGWTLGIVALVVAIMLLTPRITRAVPGSIIAIVMAAAAAAVLRLPVATIGELPDALPAPSMPTAGLETWIALLGPAFTVAMLAAIESLLSARVAASISDTGQVLADRELVGQGLASIAAGFFGGMPATGAIARTAVNIRSGGRTRLAAVVHAVVLLGVVYLASQAVATIPLAALAGVLMVTSVKMVPVRAMRVILTSTRSAAAIFVLTALVTVSVDLIYAVGIGILAAAFFSLRALAKSSGVHRQELPGPAQPGDERIAVFRIDGALFFGAAERVLARVEATQGVSVVVLRMSQVQILDATGAQALTELVTALEGRGITVLIKGIRASHMKLATRVGVIDSLRVTEHLFDDLDEAVAHARSHVARELAAAAG
ncbi:SulP family inorganic anion transporter [Tessaracoccus lacteus]|uniref:SulP family inorganic anion transporter n=1 Tax=Tessaracoccus lacteus TaxID=3041766 RepID=A0ABY8Q0V4_9ACTN|nr:SulP family inorganic anion transporter [Tessaracoccus sp. T21]WGT48206.1 SulP family inorganic anion transporter [Tessaracoccus sp. T21]